MSKYSLSLIDIIWIIFPIYPLWMSLWNYTLGISAATRLTRGIEFLQVIHVLSYKILLEKLMKVLVCFIDRKSKERTICQSRKMGFVWLLKADIVKKRIMVINWNVGTTSHSNCKDKGSRAAMASLRIIYAYRTIIRNSVPRILKPLSWKYQAAPFSRLFCFFF